MNRSRHNINFLPADFQGYILRKIKEESIFFRISSPRKSKLGDYKYNYLQKTHAISVNVDLSEIQFLITFIHELAHKKCYDQFLGKVASHGKEWKQIFSNLLIEAKSELNLTDDWLVLFNQYIKSPKASSTSIDVIEEGGIKVSDLETDERFVLKTGRKFQMIKKRRTRYLCTDLSNGKLYAVSGNAQIDRIL